MKKFILIIIIIANFSLVFSNVGILGSQVDILKDNGYKVSSYIVNREEIVKSQINVHYELRRISDLSLFYQDIEEYSFDKNEVKFIKKEIKDINLPNGDYFLDVIVRSGANKPLSQSRNIININSSFNSNVYFEELPYLKIYYPYEDGRVRYELSYSQIGKPIIPNTTFEVKFNLKSQEIDNGLLKLFLKSSYNRDNEEEIYSENINFNENNLNFSVPLKLTEAGTYDLFVKIYDDAENLIANKETRVVIMGQGGKIIDVYNSQDIYKKDENFNLNVQYVGPADAVSITENCYLKMLILVDNQVVAQQVKNIDKLDFNPFELNFNLKLNQDLDNYAVKLILGKDDKIFDEIQLNYEELNPEILISDDGRMYDPNEIACFTDNICTDVEKNLGNCFDCVSQKYESEKNELDLINEKVVVETPILEKNNYSLYYLIIGILVIFSVIVFLYWRIKKNE